MKTQPPELPTMTGARMQAAASTHAVTGGSTVSRARRIAFTVWAAMLALVVGPMFVATTVLTIVVWFANPTSAETNPVVDLGFFALGGLFIGTGLALQLRAPERHLAGLQQALIGLTALTLAGLLGQRVEPLWGGAILVVAAAILVALHPGRREILKLGGRLSTPLVGLSLLAAVPAVAYAAAMLALAREAGPSCFLGQCAQGDRFAEMAALAATVVLVGLLAAARPAGWRISAWSVGTAAIIVGIASIVLPDFLGALGQVGGVVALTWGVVFLAIAEREARSSGGRPPMAVDFEEGRR